MKWTGPNQARPTTIPNFNFSRATRKLINSIAIASFFKNYQRNWDKSGGLKHMSYSTLISTARTFSWTCSTYGCNCIPLSTLFTKIPYRSRAPLFLTTASSRNSWEGWKESTLRPTQKIPIRRNWRLITPPLKPSAWDFSSVPTRYGIRCSGLRIRILARAFLFLRGWPRKLRKVFSR